MDWGGVATFAGVGERPINTNINQKSMSSFGRKIILPMIAAVIAQIKTAPA